MDFLLGMLVGAVAMLAAVAIAEERRRRDPFHKELTKAFREDLL